MDDGVEAHPLSGKNVVVVGGSKGLGRSIVAVVHAQGAQVLAVARKQEPLAQLANDFPGVRVIQLDATDEHAPERVFATLPPDILVVSAGAIPHTAPIGEQSWEQFSRNWNADVKLSFLFTQAALNTPLPQGTTIILIASSAALGGSPLSGGYAGSKRTQMFIADYAQRESERMKLGLRFFALVPQGMMPETDLGKTAVEAYASSLGISAQDFIRNTGSPQTAEDMAHAVVEFAGDSGNREGHIFSISRHELKALS